MPKISVWCGIVEDFCIYGLCFRNTQRVPALSLFSFVVSVLHRQNISTWTKFRNCSVEIVREHGTCIETKSKPFESNKTPARSVLFWPTLSINTFYALTKCSYWKFCKRLPNETEKCRENSRKPLSRTLPQNVVVDYQFAIFISYFCFFFFWNCSVEFEFCVCFGMCGS